MRICQGKTEQNESRLSSPPEVSSHTWTHQHRDHSHKPCHLTLHTHTHTSLTGVNRLRLTICLCVCVVMILAYTFYWEGQYHDKRYHIGGNYTFLPSFCSAGHSLPSTHLIGLRTCAQKWGQEVSLFVWTSWPLLGHLASVIELPFLFRALWVQECTGSVLLKERYLGYQDTLLYPDLSLS